MTKRKPITSNDRDIAITIACLPEDLEIEGNASAVDEVTDKRTEQWIRDQLENGNPWAWCTVMVRVTYRGVITHEEYLGACSYEGEEAFRAGGYFDDMLATCIVEINRKIALVCGPRKGS